MIAITAAALLTPRERIEHPLLLLDGEVIAEVSSRSARELPAGCRCFDFPDGVLAPAYLDIHIHGGAGHDVMQANAEGLSRLELFLAEHGVSGYLPTTVTAPEEQILRALEGLANAIESAAPSGQGVKARPLGIHLEGPFISHARRGVHPPEYLVPPTLARFERFWQAARGHIKMMTIAPEVEGALEVIAEAARRGVCCSLGHSDSSLEIARAAIAAGAHHATHTFNAMRPLDHRQPGILGAVLTDSRITADIIADGIHLDPTVVQLFLRAKGAEAAVLITDAISATGMPDGRYRLGSFEVEVRGNRCTSEGRLAGSVLRLDQAVRNVMQFAGWNLSDAVRLASANPASVVGITGKGVLARGADADVIVLSPRGEVRKIFVAGRINE
ncbi:MAG TPA: N-acetylglucosamine-6-phosphate deacetylase [Terriglobales bacterium]|nr:N-acetylglucosamine-6-phosphate deacetylase [Terriglobales bacterium]